MRNKSTYIYTWTPGSLLRSHISVILGPIAWLSLSEEFRNIHTKITWRLDNCCLLLLLIEIIYTLVAFMGYSIHFVVSNPWPWSKVTMPTSSKTNPINYHLTDLVNTINTFSLLLGLLLSFIPNVMLVTRNVVNFGN